MRIPVLLLLAALAASPADAQRNAVSADLSPQAAAAAFVSTVIDVCVPAVAGNGVSSLDAARAGQVQPTQDAATRRQAGAEPGETVWDVSAARGVVTVRESSGACAVTVYGPETLSTFRSLDEAAAKAGFKLWGYMSPGLGVPVSNSMFLEAEIAGRKIMMSTIGASPGTQGHQSQYPVITSTVRLVQ
jgi:hypothetical protein